MRPLSSPRLQRLARPGPSAGVPAGAERCDLCAADVAGQHRHLLDLSEQRVLCACQACSVLFDDQAAGGRHYRLLPLRRKRLDGLRLDGTLWAGLEVPVDLAFFVDDSAAGQTTARYPSPAGTLRHVVPPQGWRRLVDANPVLEQLRPDVEALVINRSRGAADHWLLPLDECYRLTALLRQNWVGFDGGTEVWERIADFFGGIEEAT